MAHVSHSATADPLAHTHMQVGITDLVADYEINHRFRNTGEQSIEAVFTFPTPLDATFIGMQANLAGEALHAEVQPARHAARRYDDAIADGDSGALLHMPEPGLLCITLGNLLPGEEAEVLLRFAAPLGMADRVARFSLPTVQRPRYGHWNLPKSEAPNHDFATGHPLTATIRVEGLLATATVHSRTHAASFKRQGDTTVLSLESAMLDRDVVLTFELPPAWQASGHLIEDGDAMIGLATVVAPLHPSGQQPLDLCLLLDCSGSMQGDAAIQSGQALRAVTDELEADDRIQVIRFGSSLEPMLRRPLRATDRVRELLRELAPTVKADLGGTCMDAALLDAILQLAPRCEPDRSSAIILVTDGAVQPRELEMATEVAQEHGIRIFVVAVGSSAGGEVLEPLASVTRATLERAVPTEPVDACVMRHFRRARQAGPWALEIDWPAQPAKALPADEIYPGDAVTLYARLPRGSQGTARVRIPALGWAASVPLDYSSAAHPALRALYGEALYRHTDNARRRSVALRYGLLTRETSAVLVKPRAEIEKGNDLPVIATVTHMLPDGMLVASVSRRPLRTGESDDVCFNELDIHAFLTQQTGSDESVAPIPAQRVIDIVIALYRLLLARLRADAGMEWSLEEAVDQLPSEQRADAQRLCKASRLSGRNGAVLLLDMLSDENLFQVDPPATDEDLVRLARLVPAKRQAHAARKLQTWMKSGLSSAEQGWLVD